MHTLFILFLIAGCTGNHHGVAAMKSFELKNYVSLWQDLVRLQETDGALTPEKIAAVRHCNVPAVHLVQEEANGVDLPKSAASLEQPMLALNSED